MQPDKPHANNFNLLRLVFATLVILSHAAVLTDGDWHREPFKRLFGAINLGEFAVDGFFLLSGYLIIQSWHNKPQLVVYMKKRVARIFPAFVVVSLISAGMVGYLGADHRSTYFLEFNKRAFLKGMLWLNGPFVPGVFGRLHIPNVNGSLWTISYEFRCYILVAVCGMIGLTGKRWLWLIISAACLLMTAAPSLLRHGPAFSDPFFGTFLLIGIPAMLARFVGFFFAGGCFYLFRDRITFSRRGAIVAALCMLPALFFVRTASSALAIGGGYLLFAFGFAQIPSLKRFQSMADISYGTYLYGWPCEQLLLFYLPPISPWLLFVLATLCSYACGLASWHLVEKHFKPRKTALT